MYPLFVHELSLSKLSGFLLHHWVLKRDIYVLCFLYFMVPLLSCLNSTLTVLHVPRIIVLHSRFLDVPVFCSWIVTLQAFWFFVALLGAWEGHICSSFLVFCGTPLKLSQFHVNYAACPEDLEPLAASGYPSPVLSLDFVGFFNGLFCWKSEHT